MARLFTAIACTIRRPALTALAAAALALPALPAAGARTGENRRRRRTGDRRGGQHLDLAGRVGGNSARRSRWPGARPQLPPGSPFEEFFEEFFKNRRGQGDTPGAEPAAAPRQLARLRLRDRCVRHRRHQQSRHRGGRRDHRDLHRRPPLKAEVLGTRPEDRPGGAAREERQAAQGGEVRRFRQGAARRMGDRDRQPVQPRRHGDRRHRLGAQPRHQFRSLRQLHPDRRLDQPRQLRRPAVQHGRRGGRREHRDHLAVGRLDRHRLRRAVEDRDAGDRPAPQVRRNAARLARRQDPAGHRRDRREPRTSSRRAAR